MDAPAHVREGEEEHHEKKSVLKKVKDKALKIKGTLGKKKHSNGDDRNQGYEEDGEDEYDDEEGEKMEEDPAIHGAAGNVHDSAAERIGVAGREEHPQKGGVNLGGVLEEDRGTPKGQSDASIPGSDETNVTDSGSTGGVEPGVIQSFNQMSVSEQPERGADTRSHGKFSPDSTSSTDHSSSEKPQAIIEKDTGGVGERQEEEKRSSAPSSIADRVTPAKNAAISAARGSTEYGKNIASTVYEKVAGAGTAVLSKVQPAKVQPGSTRGVGERDEEEKRSSAPSSIADRVTPAKDAAISAARGSTEYGKNIASTVYEKVAGAGTAVLSKVQPGNTGTGGNTKGQNDKLGSVKEFLAQKLSPGEEDRALCNVISGGILKRKEEEEDVVEEPIQKPGEEPIQKPGEEPIQKPTEEPIQKPREEPEELVRGPERSGSGERNARDGAGPAGEGVVSKIKGAVTSLFSGGGATHTAAESGVQPGGEVERSSEKQEDRKLQESTN